MSYETEEKLSDITTEMWESGTCYDAASWVRLCNRIDGAAERFVDEVNSLVRRLVDARVRQSQASTDAESVERELDNVCKAFTGRQPCQS